AQPAVAENTGNQETVQSHTGPLVGSAPEVEALPASTSEAVIDDRKPKRKAKPKEDTPAATPGPEVASPAANTDPVQAQHLTIDDLRAALQRFTAAHGMPAGIELLKGFECARISELAEKGDDVKAAFVAKCPVMEAA
ncbi:MAG TPA: hypothetical protein VHQ87_07690, partial [Rhizobacter sp.]|nr:hypothetical protein [Rhizobacter sp.]